MRILFIGDVFGDIGRRVLAEHLPSIKEEFKPDVVVANGENCAGGRGVTVNYAKKMRKYGVDVITGGNHSHAQIEVFDDEKMHGLVLRPSNISGMKRGKGHTIYTLPDGRTLGVLNLLGKTFINGKIRCPFKETDKMIPELAEATHIFVDIHAEATSEKVCLAHYLDGQVGAICGTHTHVQTNDARIFPQGTAFITDAGMTGPEYSAIGMQHEPVLYRIITGNPAKFVQSKEGPMFNGVIIELDDVTKKAVSIEPILRRFTFED